MKSETTDHKISKLIEALRIGPLRVLEPTEQTIFETRLRAYWNDLRRPLVLLYGQRTDFEQYVQRFVHIVASAYAERPRELHQLDWQRMAVSDWFQQSQMIGYVCYVDRFNETLPGVAEKLDYLKELGITYLHLMPLLKPRSGPNDGGYAVEDYREVDPKLGTMSDLNDLATALRQEGMSLCIDLVCNHTAKEHEWAQRALAGEAQYQDYYLMYPDRTLPDEYEKTLREIFPDFAPGSFTYYEAIDRWVWTTFNEYQWDLNYANPAVFGEMLATMLYLANRGVEVLRLDAVAFMWKRLGTDSENQPEAHALLQAWRALSRIAAPSLLLKAEAIVPPPQLLPYLGVGEAANKECEIAYHNVLMVMLWSSLAEQQVRLMTHALRQLPEIPSRTAWVTYVRCHDDIGWAVTEEDAAAVGLNGFLHRAFLSDFYSGRFPGSFARGETFQHNPKTGDRRISGAGASLAGLEIALENGDETAVHLAIRRILLVHSVIFAFGGIPLIYMGDEIGLLNDRSYEADPNLADDNRWVHRPFMDWEQADRRGDDNSVNGRLFQGFRRLVEARRQITAFHAEARRVPIWTHNDHIFGLIRQSPRGEVLVLGNFSPQGQTMPSYRLKELGFDGPLIDRLNQRFFDGWFELTLEPYEAMWLEKAVG